MKCVLNVILVFALSLLRPCCLRVIRWMSKENIPAYDNIDTVNKYINICRINVIRDVLGVFRQFLRMKECVYSVRCKHGIIEILNFTYA